MGELFTTLPIHLFEHVIEHVVEHVVEHLVFNMCKESSADSSTVLGASDSSLVSIMASKSLHVIRRYG